jgi:hypothetical protein
VDLFISLISTSNNLHSFRLCLFNERLDMLTFIQKIFGGLTKEYYFRQLFFGALFLICFYLFLSDIKKPFSAAVITYGMLVVNTLLYPYSRFVYESIVSFVAGRDTIFVGNLILLFVTKVITMGMCWAAAIIIAPFGLIYLYFHNSKSH